MAKGYAGLRSSAWIVPLRFRGFGLCGSFGAGVLIFLGTLIGVLVFLGVFAGLFVFTCGFWLHVSLRQRLRGLSPFFVSVFIFLYGFFFASFSRLFPVLLTAGRFFLDGRQQVLHPHARGEPFYVAGPSGLFQIGRKFFVRGDSLISQKLQNSDALSLLRLEQRKEFPENFF
jgi:hypothetical protein